jgi:hypothetical protein
MMEKKECQPQSDSTQSIREFYQLMTDYNMKQLILLQYLEETLNDVIRAYSKNKDQAIYVKEISISTTLQTDC